MKPRLGDCAYGRFVAHALFARWTLKPQIELPFLAEYALRRRWRLSRDFLLTSEAASLYAHLGCWFGDIAEARGTEPKLNSASAIRRTPTFVHRCGVQIAFVIVQQRFVSYSGLIHGAKRTERLVSHYHPLGFVGRFD